MNQDREHYDRVSRLMIIRIITLSKNTNMRQLNTSCEIRKTTISIRNCVSRLTQPNDPALGFGDVSTYFYNTDLAFCVLYIGYQLQSIGPNGVLFRYLNSL